MQFLPGARLASLSAIAAFVFFAAAVLTLSLVGTRDGAPPSAWGEALAANGRWAQASGFLHALTGFALAAFVWHIRERAETVPTWGVFAGLAWAMSFVLGGILIFASVEAAGYQQDPQSAKTALILGHLAYANPIAALAGGTFAFAAGFAPLPGWPSWFPPLSKGLGGLAMATTILGSVGGIGLIGMAPLAAWLVVAASVAPIAAFRPSRDEAS